MPVVAAYPNSVPSFTTKADDVDTVFADHINILQAEVAAIAAALGTLPAASYGTVKARIAAAEASAAASAAHFDSGGLIPESGVANLAADLAALNASISSLNASVNGMLSAWTTYTPTVTGSGSNPVFNAGGVVGRYKVIGKTMFLNVLTGTPTNVGNGIYSFWLPGGYVAANNGMLQSGAGFLLASSLTAGYALVTVELHPNNPSFQAHYVNVGTTGGGPQGGQMIDHNTGVGQFYCSMAIEVA